MLSQHGKLASKQELLMNKDELVTYGGSIVAKYDFEFSCSMSRLLS